MINSVKKVFNQKSGYFCTSVDVEIKLFAGCNKFMLKSAHQTLTALNLNTADVSYWITGFAEFKCISPCFYFQVLDKDPSGLKELALMSKWIQEKSLSLQWRKVFIIIMFKCICQHCQIHIKLLFVEPAHNNAFAQREQQANCLIYKCNVSQLLANSNWGSM